LAQARLHQRRNDKPEFNAIAEHDSVLDTDYVLDTFSQRFRHTASQLISYGELPPRAAETTRDKASKDSLPDYRISRIS
ncbi:alpha/beta hydrolase, partial [Pseudomonas syringae pv. tagetis]